MKTTTNAVFHVPVHKQAANNNTLFHVPAHKSRTPCQLSLIVVPANPEVRAVDKDYWPNVPFDFYAPTTLDSRGVNPGYLF